MKTKPKSCRRCPYYHQPRVKGYGSTKSSIAFVGEAPGKDEVEVGRPFVGAAGEMLNDIMRELKIKRKNVYMTNTVLCRPPKNEDPKVKAIQKCRKRLWKSLIAGKFKLVVCLGRFAGNEILGDFKWCRFKYIPQLGKNVIGVAVKHPAYWNYRGKDLDGAVSEYRVIKKWLKHPNVFDKEE